MFFTLGSVFQKCARLYWHFFIPFSEIPIFFTVLAAFAHVPFTLSNFLKRFLFIIEISKQWFESVCHAWHHRRWLSNEVSWDLCHSPGRPHQQLFWFWLKNFFFQLLLWILLFWAFFPAFLMLPCQTREQGGLLEVILSFSSPSHNLQTEHEDLKDRDEPSFCSARMPRPKTLQVNIRQRYSRPMADVSKRLFLSALSLMALLHKEAIKIGCNQRLFAAWPCICFALQRWMWPSSCWAASEIPSAGYNASTLARSLLSLRN